MKGAALIYLVTGLGVLLFAISVAVSAGIDYRVLVLLVIGLGPIVMARDLLLGKSDARNVAIVASAVICVGFGGELIWIVSDLFPDFRRFGVPPTFRWLLGTFAALAVAHAIALALLLYGPRAKARESS